MRKTTKVNLFLTALAITLAVVVFVLSRIKPSEVTAGWGDNGGGRPSYTLDEINADILKDTIIFNTISDSVNGNEKNFVSAREYDDSGPTGEEYIWNTR